MMDLKGLEGKSIRLIDIAGDEYVGRVSEYIYADDNVPVEVEAIVLDYPIKNGRTKYNNLIEFTSKEIETIEIINKGDGKVGTGNVLVIGNSGVGKSTLINAVLGSDVAKTGYGTRGVTDELEIYGDDNSPFRIIDTIGFEPTFIKEKKAINAVKKWSKDSAKEGCEDTQINVIWFCVDGTSRKLFPKAIQSLSKATAMWKSVPVIVVITKSYSVPERKENIEMVQSAFASQTKYSKNLKKIIPVVASTYELNENAYAAPEGIAELIDATNELMPEGIRAGANDIAEFKLNRKRVLAQSVIGVATTSATVVGTVPIPIADAMILAPLETAEVNAIAKIYGVKNDEKSKRFFNSIVEVGTVSLAAKTVISMLKTVPIAGSVLNAIIAGAIAAALGEGTAYAFEQIYLGKKTVEDVDWVTKFMESKLAMEFVEKIKQYIDECGDNLDAKQVIGKLLKSQK